MKTKNQKNAQFTKSMKKTHTILLPDMLPYHNRLLQAAFAGGGYKLEILPIVENMETLSLPYLSGDYCLPVMLILGQMLMAVKSGRYQADSIAFMEPQTGGACRAGNYYNSIINALKKAGYPQIPVISLNAFGEEKHEGFTITPKLLFLAIAAVCYGDLIMTLYQQVRAYEAEPFSAERCMKKWIEALAKDIEAGRFISESQRVKKYREIVKDFSDIPVLDKKCRRVGIAGEIYIKFSPAGNSNLEEFLKEQNCDYRMGGFINYAIYLVDAELENARLKGAGAATLKVYSFVVDYLRKLQRSVNTAITENGRFSPDADFDTLKKYAEPVISKNCNIGDGWLVCAEVLDLIKQGYESILIVHPFGCLVSHSCERGILKLLHSMYPDVNIQSIEYDYDSSKTLRESRILLGLADGKKYSKVY